MRRRLLHSLLFALLAAPCLRAQQPSFRIFTTDDGLVRNWVTKLHRDFKGYLWICTVEGISLFDGYRFTNFTTRDGLPSRLVNDMIETPGGDIWFATEGGLALFNKDPRAASPFVVIRVGDNKSSNRVQALYQDPDGTIWCGTLGGLYRFRPQDGETGPRPVPLGRRPVSIQALVGDWRRNLWLATEEALLRRRPDGRTEAIKIPVGWQRLDALLVDRRGRVWAGGFGLACIDANTEPPRIWPASKIPSRTPGRIATLYLGEDGEIWIGKNSGLIRFDPDAASPNVQVYAASASSPFENVTSIAHDIHHNLWMGVGTRGLLRFAAGSLDHFSGAEGLDSVAIQGLVESAAGTFYAVTGEWTLNEFRGNRFVPFVLSVPRPGTTWAGGPVVVQDHEGAWWAASADGVLRYAAAGSLQQLRGKLPERIYSARDGLPSSNILRLFLDSHDNIWAGATYGLGQWNRATGRWRSFRTSELFPGPANPEQVHSIAEDRAGNIWVGMYPSGLVRLRGNSSEPITRDVPAGAIKSLLADREGELWIGSSQGGLGRIEDPTAKQPRIRRYSLEQGLSSDHVFSLAEDDAGRIYIATGRGVDRLDRKTGSMRHFTSFNGLPPGETQMLFRDREGSIWFASLYGLSRYRPEPDQASATAAPLLRTVHIDGRRYPIAVTGEREVKGLELTPGQNHLEVEFRALHFDVGETLRYQYRLEGADGEWSLPSTDQTVRYANLAPGKYRFAVRSVVESGQTSGSFATVTFEVLPVFWRRSWFLAIAFAVIAAGVVSLHRYRVQHLIAMERVRTRLATDLHDDLGAGLAEIAILSEVAKRLDGSRSLQTLDGIAARARSLREAMSDIVWMVDPREDSLSDLVLRLRQAAFTLLETEERSVEFLAPSEDQLDLELAPELRRHVLLFFKEAVTNVARHADATAIRVEISRNDGLFLLVIQDNGRGFDPLLPRSGHGLKSLQYRARELRGSCRVESEPSLGTKVELSLPLG